MTDFFSIQKKIYETLVTDGVCDGRIFDRAEDLATVDSAARYPYVLIDNVSFEPKDAIGAARVEAFLTLQILSNYRGKREIHEITPLILGALHQKALVISTDVSAIFLHLQTQVFTEGDSGLYRGVMRFRVTY